MTRSSRGRRDLASVVPCQRRHRRRCLRRLDRARDGGILASFGRFAITATSFVYPNTQEEEGLCRPLEIWAAAKHTGMDPKVWQSLSQARCLPLVNCSTRASSGYPARPPTTYVPPTTYHARRPMTRTTCWTVAINRPFVPAVRCYARVPKLAVSFTSSCSPPKVRLYNLRFKRANTSVKMSTNHVNWDEATTKMFMDLFIADKNLMNFNSKGLTKLGWQHIYRNFKDQTCLCYEYK